ncbi:MAG: thiamine-phosphate kinase [Planctomycetaceae bacterium]|nr:thiamine-phosphate kinase [Planctomycetaceae bacterium]
MSHEFEFIHSLQQNLNYIRADIDLGIGDDCAVWKVGDQKVLLASDLLVEGVHFNLNDISYEQVGRKALAVNLSDIAAMAGTPCTALVSLAIPTETSKKQVEELMRGMLSLGHHYGTDIVGGDTTSHNGPLMVNVAMTGLISREPVKRSGAKQGDIIFVTGPLGGSITQHHWSFTPRIHEAAELSELACLNSMIDLSDGLASDIRHIVHASNVGCVLDAQKIPISDSVEQSLSFEQRLFHALSDGEDFELLMTVSEDEAKKLRSQTRIKLFEVGVMQGDPNSILMRYSDDTLKEVSDSGWKHKFQ